MKVELTKYDKIAIFIIYSFLICAISVGVTLALTKEPTTRPVEEIVNVDSIIKTNSSIKQDINKLDSIANEEINNVKVLDNDSSIKLFYKLIK